MYRQQSFQNNKPTLYIIATPIGNMNEISERMKQVLAECSYVFCEDTRVTGLLLSKLGIKKNLISAYENIERTSSLRLIELLSNNENVAMMSDAGYPGISDPGHILIEEAIKNNFNVSIVNGPSALICAVLGSGFDTTHFYFYGFLDAKQSARRKELESLKTFGNTMIFYQSPHKILESLNDMLETFGDRDICLCREMTKKFEEYIRGKISEIIPVCESLKGEMVLVVKGCEPQKKEEGNIEACYQMVLELIKKGYKSKDAVKEIAGSQNISKNELYQYYIDRKEN